MRNQWHMVCRALSATPRKKQRPLLVTGALAAKRTISRNGRCVGIYCMRICDPLLSKWRIYPDRQHRFPIPHVCTCCMRQRAKGMDDFLPSPAFPIPACVGRCKRVRMGLLESAHLEPLGGTGQQRRCIREPANHVRASVTWAVSDRNDRPKV